MTKQEDNHKRMHFSRIGRFGKISLKYIFYVILLAGMVNFVCWFGGNRKNLDYVYFNETGQNGFLFLKRENIYQFIVKKTQIKSMKYLKMLKSSQRLRKFPKNILIKKDPMHIKIPNELHIRYNDTVILDNETFRYPIFTAFPQGRLGNIMSEYATLFSLGKLYNVPVFMHPEMKKSLFETFPYLSMRSLPEGYKLSNCVQLDRDEEMDNYSAYEIAAAGLFGPKCFILMGYPVLATLFHPFRTDIFKEFTFSTNISQQARYFKENITKEARETLGGDSFTDVGVHVRRSDFHGLVKSMKGYLPGYFYLRKALNHYRNKYNNTVFIVASDDMDYVKNIFSSEKDVFFSGKSREMDMAVLTLSDHSIMTLGTFGFWCSYLTGGEVVYADAKTKKLELLTSKFFTDANISNFINL